MSKPNVRNNSIRELRDNRSNVQGQAKFESDFTKPSADKQPGNLDHLYFKGVTGKAPSKVEPNKNYSSIDRVYGLDADPNQQPMPQPGNQAIAASPSMSFGKGKKIIGGSVGST